MHSIQTFLHFESYWFCCNSKEMKKNYNVDEKLNRFDEAVLTNKAEKAVLFMRQTDLFVLDKCVPEWANTAAFTCGQCQKL